MPNTVERTAEILEYLGKLTEGTLYEDLDDFILQYLSQKDDQTVGSLQATAGYFGNVFRIDQNSAEGWLFEQKGDLQGFYDYILEEKYDSWGSEPRKWIHGIMVSRKLTPLEILDLYEVYVFLLHMIE